MKPLFAILCLLGVTSLAQPGAIPLAWNASTTPGVTNYFLYAGTNGFNPTNLTTAIRVSAGTNLAATVTDLAPGAWWFAATAGKAGIESAPSAPLLVDVPQPPTAMRTVLIQFSATLTNFYDVGFFKIRLGGP